MKNEFNWPEQEAPDNTQVHTPGRIDWSFLFQWLLATTVGWVIGWLVIQEAGVGVVLGLAQWLVLRQYVAQAGWWIWATTVGWAVGWAIIVTGVLLPPGTDLLSSFISGLVLGGLLGISQWLILRRWVKLSALWIPASLIGWAVAMTGLLGQTVVGTVVGILTGLVLDWLLRHPVEPATPE